MEDKDYKLEGEGASEQEAAAGKAAPQSGENQDGEYHFVRPEQKLYEDAGYVSQNETSSIPSYYTPSERKPKEKKTSEKSSDGLTKKIICLCLACTLIGGTAGGLVSWQALRGSSDTADPIATSKPGNTTGYTPTGVGALSGNQIYELGCRQAVGITTEVTTTNWFGQTSSTAVTGSGFVVTTDGYIITNYHVIEYAYEYSYKVSVMFYDGTVYEAAIVGVEPDNDIAVLKIDATGLSPVSVGDSETVKVGDEVYAIGNPLGELAFSMTTGHMSALDRSIVTSQNTAAISMFQFDAAVNEGNSGGPLYNASGEVVGIVSAKYSSSGVEGLGFAIPINDAVDIANDLITKGYVTGKAYFGISLDTRYSSVYADFYKTPEGAYVYNVESGTCAETCGLKAGDIITMIDDEVIAIYSDLSSAIRGYRAGDTAVITVYRAGEYLKLDVTFDESRPSTNSNGANEYGLSSYPQLGGYFGN